MKAHLITRNPIKQLRTMLKDNFHANVVISELEMYIGHLEKDLNHAQKILVQDRVIYVQKKKLFEKRGEALLKCAGYLQRYQRVSESEEKTDNPLYQNSSEILKEVLND